MKLRMQQGFVQAGNTSVMMWMDVSYNIHRSCCRSILCPHCFPVVMVCSQKIMLLPSFASDTKLVPRILRYAIVPRINQI